MCVWILRTADNWLQSNILCNKIKAIFDKRPNHFHIYFILSLKNWKTKSGTIEYTLKFTPFLPLHKTNKGEFKRLNMHTLLVSFAASFLCGFNPSIYFTQILKIPASSYKLYIDSRFSRHVTARGSCAGLVTVGPTMV